MNSQETLWFIGKCLSLAVHPERASEIQDTLQSGKVNWESLVYHSSNQLVLPALYLNLKRNHLLKSLPEELVNHLKDITNQNRQRNQAILKQVEEISNLFRKNNLKPIYLKGTAHLLDGLYEDIAERMLSDIDLLLEEKDAKKAHQLLKEDEYQEHNNFATIAIGEHRHLPELIKDNVVASVEIHTRILEGKYNQSLNTSLLLKEAKGTESKLLVPSNNHQILYNTLNAQTNDKANSTYKILVRQSYDLMLLARRESPLVISKNFGHYFDKLNSYIALSADIMDYPDVLDFESSPKIKRHIKHIKLIWKYPAVTNFISKIYFIFFRIYRYISQFFLFFVRASVRKRIINSLRNPDYYKAHWGMYKKLFS